MNIRTQVKFPETQSSTEGEIHTTKCKCQKRGKIFSIHNLPIFRIQKKKSKINLKQAGESKLRAEISKIKNRQTREKSMKQRADSLEKSQ